MKRNGHSGGTPGLGGCVMPRKRRPHTQRRQQRRLRQKRQLQMQKRQLQLQASGPSWGCKRSIQKEQLGALLRSLPLNVFMEVLPGWCLRKCRRSPCQWDQVGLGSKTASLTKVAGCSAGSSCQVLSFLLLWSHQYFPASRQAGSQQPRQNALCLRRLCQLHPNRVVAEVSVSNYLFQ